MKVSPSVSHDEFIKKRLQENPKFMIEYLKAALRTPRNLPCYSLLCGPLPKLVVV
jgi:hypothetical protein